MNLPKRHYVDGPFGQVHFQDTGEGKPLVLLHQAPMSSRQFDSVYELLHERGVRAIGIDMPGFGLSDATDFVPRVEDYAHVVPSVLDHLSVNSAFILGHHTGALVATEVALQFKERVTALILNGPVPLTEKEKQVGLNYVETFEKTFAAQPDGKHLLTLFQNRMQAGNKDTNWSLTNRYIAEHFIGYGPFWYGHHAAFQYDHAATIPLIKHPTLILTNTGDSIYQNAKQTLKMRPDFKYAEIEGGSWDIVDERPQEWVNAVAKFVAPI